MSVNYDSRSLKDSLGKYFMLFLDGKVVAFGTSAGLQLGTEMIDTTNYLSGGYKDNVPGLKDWSIDGEAYMSFDKKHLAYGELMKKWKNDEYIKVGFIKEPTAGPEMSAAPKTLDQNGYAGVGKKVLVLAEGQALIQSLQIKGETKGILTISISLLGCGEPSFNIPESA